MGLKDWLLDELGLREKKPVTDGSGLIRWGRMDDEFREKCAVWLDGRCMIAEGFAGDNHVRGVLLALRRTGVLTGRLREEVATLSEVAAAWDESAGAVHERMDQVDPEIVNGLREIFAEAAKAKASDVEFEMSGTDCKVYAIVNDRKLQMRAPLTREMGRRLTHFLFYVKEEGSQQTGWQRNSFQGFSVRSTPSFRLPQGISALRCERGPHEPGGDHLYARLFYRDQIKLGTTLGDLGFTPEVEDLFKEIRLSGFGGVLIGGRTGDGKSTTLATNLVLLMLETHFERNLVTLEDPVEYEIPGAVQIAVATAGDGEERKEHYRKALSHFVRIHPAAGMVSEIRDGFGASQVLQFVDSGHQVWTTIHVHSANGILFRLMDLGVNASEVTKRGNIRLLMKQTLVPLLCEDCKVDRPSEEDRLPLALTECLPGAVRYRNPDGCKTCRKEGKSDLWVRAWAGYEKQLAVAEWISPDDEYLQFVGKRDAIGAWSHWTDNLGGVPIGHRIWKEVGEGRLDPEDALNKGASVEEARQVLGATGRPPLLVVLDRPEVQS